MYPTSQPQTVKYYPRCTSRKPCPKSVGYSTSTKKHDAPMSRGDMYFSLDCEMVGVGPEGLDSALARVSIVNWDEQIVLDTYVRVTEPVTDYRTFISGIQEEHVTSDNAMPLEHVQNLVAGILRGKILIGHGLENDLKALCLDHPWTDIRDTAKYAPFMKRVDTSSVLKLVDAPEFRPRKLKELAWEKLGMEIQVIGQPHSPLEDAMAAMALYKSVRAEWEMELAKAVSQSYEEPISYPGTSQGSISNQYSPLPTVQDKLYPLHVQNHQGTNKARHLTRPDSIILTQDQIPWKVDHQSTMHDVRYVFSNQSYAVSAQHDLSPVFRDRNRNGGFHFHS